MDRFCGSPKVVDAKQYYLKMVVVVLMMMTVGMSDEAAAAGGEMKRREEAAAALLDLYSSSREEMVRTAGYGEEKLSTVVITGTLLCGERMGRRGNHPGLPISGAVVSAICHAKGHSNVRKSTRARGVTDEYGDFTIDLPSHLHAIPDLHTKCSVQTLQLPKTSPCCHRKRHREITRIRLSSVQDGIRTYTAGTIRIGQVELPQHA